MDCLAKTQTEFYAHVTETGQKQTVLEHLNGVAKLARSFALKPFQEICETVGELHDIGKFSAAFQSRLFTGKPRFEHSTCGALELEKLPKQGAAEAVALWMEYCIAGHHTGLPDGGTRMDRFSPFDSNTLQARLGRESQYVGAADYQAYKNWISPKIPEAKALLAELQGDREEIIERYAFFTRYLFSCLTDADFLDTEQFCNPNSRMPLSADFKKVNQTLKTVLSGFSADTPLKAARSRLQKQAVTNAVADSQSRIFFLQMPTGSGKTLCSLQIALQKLLSKGKKRIIYVIPYTSIIEQTADLFTELFGEETEILQHHSNFTFSGKDTAEQADDTLSTAEKNRKAAENWDAPWILTTCVQFFQSLYHFRSSGLRKLHNMADSIIVFDEIHLLPLPMLQPCLRGIGYLTKYLNSEAIFLSATMPDYTDLFQRYLPDVPYRELITDCSDFSYFQKCKFQFMGMTSYAAVLEKATAYSSSLIIVNTRKIAKEVYAQISGRKYHLSTYMTPFDRSETLKRIRRDLRERVPCTVVSTSLTEAGVDLDFAAVFRQFAGLDNMLQAAGRCNRDGKLPHGDVWIFETEDKPHGDLKLRATFAHVALQAYPNITDAACVKEYYRQMFRFCDTEIQKETIADKILPVQNFRQIPFRSYAEQFQLIREDTTGIVIPQTSEAEALLADLQNEARVARRRLQRYTVSLRNKDEFPDALQRGLIHEENGVWVLSDLDSCYSPETGLELHADLDCFI